MRKMYSSPPSPRSRPRMTLFLAAGLALLMASGAAESQETSRTILVTGSTSGLGREVARSLAANGDHVILHGRNRERGQALMEEINAQGAGSARFYRADLASFAEIRELAAAIRRDYDRLDVLVNNAGIVRVGDPERRLSQDGLELHFQVNYLAGYLLTDLLLPLLKKSAPARIVNVSSLSAAALEFDNLMLEEGYSFGRAYGQSKLAQVMFTIDLAEELEGADIIVNALHPATFMNTNMVLSAGLEPRSTVEEGRDAVLQLINDTDVGTGQFYDRLELSRALDEQAYDPEARARLKEVSASLVGVGGR